MEENEILCEGYLYKWTNFIKGWRIRYFCLTNSKLTYVKKKVNSENESDRKEFDLSDLNLIDEKKKRQFLLEILNEKIYKNNKEELKIIWLKTANDDDKPKWLDALNKAFNNFKGNFLRRKDSSEDRKLKFMSQEEVREDSIRARSNRQTLSDYEDDYTAKHDELVHNIRNIHCFYLNFHMETTNFVIPQFDKKGGQKMFDLEIQKAFEKITKNKGELKDSIDEAMKNLIELKDLYLAKVRNGGKSEEIMMPQPFNSKKNVFDESVYEEAGSVLEAKCSVSVKAKVLAEPEIPNMEPNINANNDEKDGGVDEFPEDEERKSDSENQLRFQKSLSKILSDFIDMNYDFPMRKELPVAIKCSTSMVSDMIKSFSKKTKSLPIHYNEPLSMLQRQCEKFQFSHILFNSVYSESNNDSSLKLAAVASFICADLSLNINRILKPFNPILGETYEYFDNYLKIRFFAEQVSHNPPISAYICEGEEFVFFSDTKAKSELKVFSNAMVINFLSRLNCIFKSSNQHMRVKLPTIYMKGVMFGSLKYDVDGLCEISVEGSKAKCSLEFFEEGRKSKPYGYVEGKIFNDKEECVYFIKGQWNYGVYLIEAKGRDISFLKNFDIKKPEKSHDGTSMIELWRINDADNYHKVLDNNNYKMSLYAYNLNNLPDSLKSVLPKCDSRFRPDQRLMEFQQVKEAEEEKAKIENMQRERHKVFEEKKIKYEPIYFSEVKDEQTKDLLYLYKGGYWEDRHRHDFEKCHPIFN